MSAPPEVQVGDTVYWTGRDGRERSETITDEGIARWFNTVIRTSKVHTIEGTRDGHAWHWTREGGETCPK